MAYKRLMAGCVMRLADNAAVPPDPNNTDYQAYLKWKAEGGVPAPEFTAEELDAQAALASAQLQMAQTTQENLPSFQVVMDAIDGLTTIAQMRAFLKKLAAVTYFHIKNSTE